MPQLPSPLLTFLCVLACVLRFRPSTMSVSRLLVFVCVSLLAATCVAGWTWRNPNDQIADFTILKGVPCIYQYGAGANKVFYVGQATDCADRLNQHEREQAQFAQLAWSIKLTHSTGNLLDYIALNDFGLETQTRHTHRPGA